VWRAGPPFFPPPPTDAFDRADGPAGANWSGGTISGNRLRANGTVVWTPTVPADQSAQVTIRMSSATVWGYPGVVVRASATSCSSVSVRAARLMAEGAVTDGFSLTALAVAMVQGVLPPNAGAG